MNDVNREKYQKGMSNRVERKKNIMNKLKLKNQELICASDLFTKTHSKIYIYMQHYTLIQAKLISKTKINCNLFS